MRTIVVFVTDAALRRSVVICQALSAHGIEVTVGGSSRLSPGFLSRYTRHSLVYPSPIDDPEAFTQTLLKYLRRNSHALLLPLDDPTVAVCAQFREDFERVTHVPLPTSEQLRYGLDKAPLMELAEQLGLPHPRTVLAASRAEVVPKAASLRAPLVIKPRTSSAGRGIAYVSDRATLADRWDDVARDYPLPIIQECIPNGRKFGVCLLMDRDSRCVASFVQEELRHYPIRDGVSTLQLSVVRPDLVERAVQVLQAIGWYGIAEVEFMEDPLSGEVLLLEVNPRFWASIQLAISCGVNFPHLLHQLATGQSFDEVHTYRVGRHCRWLLPGDVLHFIANADRMRMRPSFFHFKSADTVYDGFYRDDLGATLGVLLGTMHQLLDPSMWHLLLRGKAGVARMPATWAGSSVGALKPV